MSITKIFHIDGKRVAIISSDYYTYHVRYIKSGKFAQVYKKYVKHFIVDSSKAKTKTKTKTKKQKPKKDLGLQQLHLKF